MTKPAPAVHRDLAWALKQQAARVGTTTPAVRGADWRLATVSIVNSDGTLEVQEAPGITIRRLASYTTPLVGDVIVISQSSSGNWLACGRTAASGTAWTPITLASGWAPNASYYTPAYRLWGDGTASLCGLAFMTGTLTSGTVAATLPAAARPASQVRAAAQVATGYFGVVTLFPNGDVTVGDFNTTLPTTGPKYLELDAFGHYRLA
ncbi:hypothetical protein [Streptomyces sp. SID8499]|uniref:hypothetical protein n=1 Tax=Streptomyces sp. SID8499 TaxID=2706106 RepID=UPI0013CA3165|nr:hypothetical protein [Streptomyces sp. SID8499]NED31127.1 hypothetical protein [Streptomyces sp. SID8499]